MIMTNDPRGNKIEDFSILAKIGSGAFATVYKARCLRPGYEDRHVAVKKISKRVINKMNIRKRVNSEICIHSNLSNPNIVKFYTTFEDENYVYLILELCSCGSLDEYLKNNGPLFEKDACQVSKQVIEGVRYLHSQCILHRDLSLKNILLTENMEVKIADFGMAAALSHPDEKKGTVLGTANFISPEVVQKKLYSFKVDCWSVGCILYALLYGKPPFDGKEKKYNEIMKDAVMCNLTFPDYASDEAKELLSNLLNKNPNFRMDIKDALQYSFFRKYEECSEKKSEFYFQKNGDSGMGSLSRSTATSSHSCHRNFRSNEIGLNFNGSDINNKRLRNSSSVPNDLQVLSSNNFSNCCPKSCDGLSKCRHIIKNKVIKEMHRSQSPTSRLKQRQFQNKIQALPSRNEVFETVSSRNVCSYSGERPYMQQGLGWKHNEDYYNEGCNFSQPAFYCDDQSEAMNSGYMKKLSKCPVSNPCQQLQNVTEDQFCSISYYTGHNTGENIQQNGMYRYNNDLSECTHENPSCSHEHYCTAENICSHEAVCSCRQHYNAASKINSRSFHSHNSCENRQKPCKEIVLERNFALNNKSLKDIVTPLTTIRLLPKRIQIKSVFVSILENGQVCVECLKSKKKKKIISQLCIISSDGQMILIYTPKQHILPSNKPPPVPGNSCEVHYFSFDDLPEIHWKKYQYAKIFVDIVRAKTAKVTVYGKDAKCVMMENSPNPNFEMCFYNGSQIMEVTNKMTLTDQNGHSSDLTCDNNNMNVEKRFMVDVFLNMKEKCIQVEKTLEMLSKSNDTNDSYFPVIVGRKPSSVLGSQDSNKENSTPQSLHSSTLNRAFNKMKSFDDTVNTSNSPFQGSLQSNTQSSVTVGKSVSAVYRNIIDIRPSLKCEPKIENGKILTEYKDGIQMWSSKDGQDVSIYDTNSRQRINIHQNKEIKKRIEHDLCGILIYIVSKERNMTK